ncbi:MAG: hypothetical protein ACXVEE_14540 [Polyangiales bacterium]
MRILPLASILFFTACTVTPDRCANDACNTGTPKGPVYGKRADGRIEVTADQAWPARASEPAALTGVELARACVALGSCLETKDEPATLIGLCTMPDGSEERAVPEGEKSERRSFVLRTALAGGSCATLNSLETPRAKEIYCEEDGCWWTSSAVTPPTVTCAGDVATMKIEDGRVLTRDCSRAYQKCDTTSPTGCSDRRPVACDPAAKDRCDGNIKLGCDHAGRVSFHDCGRVAGGGCAEDADGSASCVYPDAKKCNVPAASTCADATSVSVCVAGDTQKVDCTTLGFTKCEAGRCVK